MKLIKETRHVANSNSDDFNEELQEAIEELQEENLEVEIQYSSAQVGKYATNFNALLIGYERKGDN